MAKKEIIDWKDGTCKIEGPASLLEDLICGQQMKWHNPEREQPKDGNYLTVSKYDSSIIYEIAPWRDGKYQGSYTMQVYMKQAQVLYWMPLPAIPECVNV